eukprot:gene9141-biopygen3187
MNPASVGIGNKRMPTIETEHLRLSLTYVASSPLVLPFPGFWRVRTAKCWGQSTQCTPVGVQLSASRVSRREGAGRGGPILRGTPSVVLPFPCAAWEKRHCPRPVRAVAEGGGGRRRSRNHHNDGGSPGLMGHSGQVMECSACACRTRPARAAWKIAISRPVRWLLVRWLPVPWLPVPWLPGLWWPVLCLPVLWLPELWLPELWLPVLWLPARRGASMSCDPCAKRRRVNGVSMDEVSAAKNGQKDKGADPTPRGENNPCAEQCRDDGSECSTQRDGEIGGSEPWGNRTLARAWRGHGAGVARTIG